ncbi:MAG: hypothetical protein ACO1OB_09885 [Archangium sp.]
MALPKCAAALEVAVSKDVNANAKQVLAEVAQPPRISKRALLDSLVAGRKLFAQNLNVGPKVSWNCCGDFAVPQTCWQRDFEQGLLHWGHSVALL